MITLYFIFAHLINKQVHRRYDGCPSLPYYTAKELGLKEERFSFFSGQWKLSGSRYYSKKGPYKGLIVFFHGIGAGRTSYLNIISFLCQNGYLVYSYDYTGSMESQGPYIYGLGQAGKDQRAFFSWLDKDPQSRGLTRYGVGHSWGGYVAMLSLRKSYHVAKAVSIDGFVQTSSEYVAGNPKMHLKPFEWLIKIYLYFHGGKDGNQSVLPIIKESDGKLLYIQGTKDTMVPPVCSGLVLKKAFKDNPRVSFLDVPGRGHCPFISKESEDYQNELGKKGLMHLNAPLGLEMDIEKASHLEPNVMKAIIDFLAS